MNWISKLERKFGRYAIQNLMFYVIALYTVGFALSLVAPEFYYQYLSLNIEAVFHGQIWRLVTFLMQPPNSSALFMVFALYLYYMIGRSVTGVTINGIFCAGGDSKFGLYCDCISMWCIIVPVGLIAAFVLKLPVLAVYFIISLDEFVKIPAVYLNYKKYRWVKDLTVKSE